MSQPSTAGCSRRDLLRTSGRLAAAAALPGLVLPRAYAGEDNTIQLALVGAGGRGAGAADNALSSPAVPTKLVALADVFDHKLSGSYNALVRKHAEKVEVPEDRKYIGFDGYQKAMDCLRPGDVVILATPPAFRWPHLAYAIERGLHVFMEKPTTVDGPSTRKMLALAEESERRGLKVGVGLMCRHCAARQELHDRIQGGEIGEIVLLRAYRMHGPLGSAFVRPRPEGVSELLYQVANFHGFLWASGGCYSDFLIHNIDECCWMKDAWPVEAKASGGRHYRGDCVDQNFDSYSVEYTFADGTKLYLEGRNMPGAYQEFASYAHGSRGSAVISTSAHTPARCRTYKGQKFTRDDLTWQFPPPEPNPYQIEWDRLLTAIREDTPHNECARGAIASLVTSMGRMAAHTGQRITYEEMLGCEHEFAPEVGTLAFDSPAPVLADEHGRYPVPMPGIHKQREY